MSYETEMKQALLQKMEELKQAVTDVDHRAGFDFSMGICSNVVYLDDFMAGDVREVLNDLFEAWPLHTGDTDFPVPCDCCCPRDTYIHNSWDENFMWFNGEYAENRRKLLNFCINRLKRELKNV